MKQILIWMLKTIREGLLYIIVAHYELLAHVIQESLKYGKLLERTKQVLDGNPGVDYVKGILVAVQSRDFGKTLRYAGAQGHNYLTALIIAHFQPSWAQNISKNSVLG